MAVLYLRRFVAGFLPLKPEIESESGHVVFVVDKAELDRFTRSTSVSPANHSTDCSTLIIIHHPGLVK
jgi:hypothetical protein